MQFDENGMRRHMTVATTIALCTSCSQAKKMDIRSSSETMKLNSKLNPCEKLKNSSRKVLSLFKNKVQELDMNCT